MGAPRLLLGSDDLARRVHGLGVEIAEFLDDDAVVIGVLRAHTPDRRVLRHLHGSPTLSHS